MSAEIPPGSEEPVWFADLWRLRQQMLRPKPPSDNSRHSQWLNSLWESTFSSAGLWEMQVRKVSVLNHVNPTVETVNTTLSASRLPPRPPPRLWPPHERAAQGRGWNNTSVLFCSMKDVSCCSCGEVSGAEPWRRIRSDLPTEWITDVVGLTCFASVFGFLHWPTDHKLTLIYAVDRCLMQRFIGDFCLYN